MIEVETNIWNEISDDYEPTMVIYTANQWENK